jgi:Tfp pilus assembly protein PilN
MRAVNLIPRDVRRGGVSPSLGNLGASHLVVGLLAVAVAMVTLYVLSNNTVSQRKAQLASLNQQMATMQTQVARLQSYQKFEKLAQAREATVQEIASGRFDWKNTLTDLSKVVPPRTTFQSLVATVSASTSTGGAAGGSSGSLRGDINAPAFTIKGCTGSQDEVAQLMGRLKLIRGVARVTLQDSTQTPSGGSGGTSGTCSGPTFDMVVFFAPLTAAQATLAGVPTGGSASPVTAGGAK